MRASGSPFVSRRKPLMPMLSLEALFVMSNTSSTLLTYSTIQPSFPLMMANASSCSRLVAYLWLRCWLITVRRGRMRPKCTFDIFGFLLFENARLRDSQIALTITPRPTFIKSIPHPVHQRTDGGCGRFLGPIKPRIPGFVGTYSDSANLAIT